MTSLLDLSDSLLAIAQTRLELLVNELEGERAYLLAWLILTQVMLFCLGVGVVLAAVVVVTIVGEVYRLPALAGIALIFIGAGIAAGWLARRRSRSRIRLFANSLVELKRDRRRSDRPL
ncbi:MAG: phage holin family protein [Haliea sp.]